MNDAAAMSDTELRDLYRELILDHARHPRHFGRLDKPTHSAEGINPLCGDKLKLYLRIGRDQTIAEASFEGSGCAISVASASLLTDIVAGLKTEQAEACVESITQRLCGNADTANAFNTDRLEKLRALEGVREFPARVKCATLAWHALRSAIHNDPAPVSTE